MTAQKPKPKHVDREKLLRYLGGEQPFPKFDKLTVSDAPAAGDRRAWFNIGVALALGNVFAHIERGGCAVEDSR